MTVKVKSCRALVYFTNLPYSMPSIRAITFWPSTPWL